MPVLPACSKLRNILIKNKMLGIKPKSYFYTDKGSKKTESGYMFDFDDEYHVKKKKNK